MREPDQHSDKAIHKDILTAKFSLHATLVDSVFACYTLAFDRLKSGTKEMANVFVCHRKNDAVAAEGLALEIKNAGHLVWFDEWKIDVGDSIISRVSQGLSESKYLLLCLSSSGTSNWVDREWMSALSRQLEGYDVKVLPVRLTGGDTPAILAGIKFADLATDWTKGMQALLKALR
jgi:predicted nucleotide-binding protein